MRRITFRTHASRIELNPSCIVYNINAGFMRVVWLYFFDLNLFILFMCIGLFSFFLFFCVLLVEQRKRRWR